MSCDGMFVSSFQLLDVRESSDGSFYVPNLSKHVVTSRQELLSLVHQGSAARYTSATIMNEHSSRSHSMLTFYIERAVGPENEPDSRTIIAAKLNMVWNTCGVLSYA